MSDAESPLLSVEGLEVRFGDHTPAVSGVDLSVMRGQTVAVVGESGSGKSTTAAAMLRPIVRLTAGCSGRSEVVASAMYPKTR
jgi:peptide/nickel transport system ATP-binding protein